MKKTILLFIASVFLMSSASIFAGDVEKGKKVALTKSIGNCLACHAMKGAKQAGNMGPELINMKEKYPNKEDLRARVWDATRFNPITAMPPFGRNRILTEAQIDDVVAFLQTL